MLIPQPALRALLCTLLSWSAWAAQEPAPFGEAHAALDGFATGRWWEKSWTGKGQTWLHELQSTPREQALAFAIYTVENATLKLSAQCFPLLPEEPREVRLELRDGSEWREVGRAAVVYPGWSAHFRIPEWDRTRTTMYRVNLGSLSSFEGTLRADPSDRDEIKVGLLSCNSNADHGPRTDIVQNLRALDPDLLFFAGDQSYDHRQHTAAWLSFGLQFRELFRDRPCITIPDDHDVGHGNLWGAGGIAAPAGTNGDHGGYVLPASYVRMVERCQTSHLPDPFDATPVAQDIGVYYTRLRIGGIDFAILEDRKWKTGPGGMLTIRGPRPDHVQDVNTTPEELDLPGLELLGARQLHFLEEWSADWQDAEIKVVLSQTNFCGAVTHHGSPANALHGDLDCNGWPRRGREEALRAMRRVRATHLCGDQHLAVVVRHGIEAFDDGPFAFCGPAIQNDYYGRWWKPKLSKREGVSLSDAMPWSGRFRDAFGNRFSLHAYANPDRPGAGFDAGNGLGDGFGLVRIDKKTQRVRFEAYRRQAQLDDAEHGMYAGWPVEFAVAENDGRVAAAYLPELSFDCEDPVISVVAEGDAELGTSDEVLYTFRLRGNRVRLPLFRSDGSYRIYAGRDAAQRMFYRGGPADGPIMIRLAK